MERFFFHATRVAQAFFTGFAGAFFGGVSALILSLVIFFIQVLFHAISGQYAYYARDIASMFYSSLAFFRYAIIILPIVGFIIGFFKWYSEDET